jgi:hypothetical protein
MCEEEQNISLALQNCADITDFGKHPIMLTHPHFIGEKNGEG